MDRARYLRRPVEDVLRSGKMAFVGGPRQVGKTTLALGLLGRGADERHPAYLNWDDPRARARIRPSCLRSSRYSSSTRSTSTRAGAAS
jgi:uncharacterized protein